VHPTILLSKNKQLHKGCKEKSLLEPILETFLTIASRATPIGSAGRAPDEISVSKNTKEGERRFIYLCYYHQEGIHISQKLDNPKIFSIGTVKQG
jgi:hypothetical protein